MKKINIGATMLTVVITSLATSALWLSMAPASATAKSSNVTSLQYGEREGAKITVAPGGVGESVVTCPANWHAVSGGYVITGFVGISVPSAVENAIGTSGHDWYVQIANPKASSGDIAFRAEVTCLAAVY